MRKFLARIFLALGLVLSLTPQLHAAEDNTICFVLEGGLDDSQPTDYNTLRRKVEQGYVRDYHQFCSDLIRIKTGVNVTLLSPLNITNKKDRDCSGESAIPSLCGDGFNLVVDAQSGRATIDVTAVPAGECGIEVGSNLVKFSGIDITATAEQVANRKALCDTGSGNDFSDVKVNGQSINCGNGKTDAGEECDDGNQNNDDLCDNQCKNIEQQPSPSPLASPSPSPDVLNIPTGLTAVNDPSSTAESLKVLLTWQHSEGTISSGFTLSPALDISKFKKILNADAVMEKKFIPMARADIDVLQPGVIDQVDPGSFEPLIPKDFDFDIERATKEGDTCGTFSPLTSVNGNHKTHQDATVAAKTTYCYRVRATRGTEHTEYSNVAQVRTPDPTIVAPTALEASTLSEDSIFVRWVYSTTAVGITFQLERGDENCTAASFSPVGVPIVENEFTDTGLNASKTYCYRVYALSDTTPPEQSLYSNTDKATTLDPGASPLPTPVATPDATPEATPQATPPASPDATPNATPDATPEATPPVSPNDRDGDGVKNEEDNCPDHANTDQKDLDGDGAGDPCDPDADGDGVLNGDEIAGGSDPLDADTDDDQVPDNEDNCPTLSNPDQLDSDQDSIGNVCEVVPNINDLPSGGGCSLSVVYQTPFARLIYLAAVALLGYGLMRKRAK